LLRIETSALKNYFCKETFQKRNAQCVWQQKVSGLKT